MAYGNSFQRTSPVVLNLIIINTLIFFAQQVFGSTNILTEGAGEASRVDELFALHPYSSQFFRPYQLITHMFMHGSFPHLLFNMFGLFMFGSIVERVWDAKRFLIFYLICGLGAGLAQMASYAWQFRNVVPDPNSMLYLLSQYSATVGASGAIMGVLAAFGYLFPNTELFILFIPVPVKAKWAVTGFILIDVFSGIAGNSGDNVAHFAHVGGALVGLLIVLYWNKTNKRTFY